MISILDHKLQNYFATAVVKKGQRVEMTVRYTQRTSFSGPESRLNIVENGGLKRWGMAPNAIRGRLEYDWLSKVFLIGVFAHCYIFLQTGDKKPDNFVPPQKHT